jgi:hypothetical protein
MIEFLKDPKKLHRLITIILLTYLSLFFYNFIIGGYFVTTIPIEAREFATLSSILKFKNNENPFSFENFPRDINAYSAIWPYFISQFLNFFDINSVSNIILSIRSFSFLLMILSSIYLAAVSLKKKNDYNVIFILIIFFLISFTSKISIGIWSNGLGLLFYFFGIYLSFRTHSKKNFFLSSFFIIIAMHLKFYFILGFIIILSNYIFLIFKKEYFKINLLLGLIFFLIILGHYYFFPTYYYISIWNQISLTGFEEFNFYSFLFSKKLYSEIFFFLKNYFYLIIFFFIAIYFSHKNKKLLFKKNIIKLLFILFFLFIIVFKLWPNHGNFGTYTNNLIVPLLIAFMFSLEIKLNIKYLNYFIVIIILFPLSTPIFNFDYPGTLKDEYKIKNKNSINLINDYIKNNSNIYIDHYLGNVGGSENINKFFNGNTEHIRIDSVKNINNIFIKKFLSTEKLEKNFKKNYRFAELEISKNYDLIICTFICPNEPMDVFLSEYSNLLNNNDYNLKDQVKVNNIFGQSYNIKIYKLN